MEVTTNTHTTTTTHNTHNENNYSQSPGSLFKRRSWPGTFPVTPPTPTAAPKPTVAVWERELTREQWNLFSPKVLTRLAQSDDLQIDVQVKATLKEGQTTEPLNTALKELGIQEGFKRQ